MLESPRKPGSFLPMRLAKVLAAFVVLLSGCGKTEPLTDNKTPVNSGPSPEPSVAPSPADAAGTPAAATASPVTSPSPQ